MEATHKSGRSWTWVAAAALAGLPAIVLFITKPDIEPTVTAVIYLVAIVGGAFLLSWAAEVAQLDVSASLAIAVLALVAILPEYAIEAVLAWKAGASYVVATGDITPEMSRVAANVTGANRLLIGLGWSAVILIYYIRRRQTLDLRGYLSLEMIMLGIATLLSFFIFFMREVHLVLAAVLIGLYVFYLWSSSTQESEEPELIGAARLIGSLPTGQRRTAVLALFFYSAGVILVSAEPFVDGLIETGLELGIDEFILIQWIAPLASESPEIIIAVLFSLRSNPVAGLSTLISSEVNQLTILIGSMVVIFSLSAGQPLSFGLDDRQSAEFLLTSALSVFALLMIAPRLITWKGATVLLVLFVVHLFFTDGSQRLIFAYGYLALSLGLIVYDRRRVLQVFGGTKWDSIDET